MVLGFFVFKIFCFLRFGRVRSAAVEVGGAIKLYNSPVMLVVMASLLHINCRLHVVYVQLISVRLLVEKFV